MIHNPEQLEDEIFVGNWPINREKPYLSSLKTLRHGKIAYSIHGEKLEENWVPVFIGRSEQDAYDRIMMNRFNKIRRSPNI